MIDPSDVQLVTWAFYEKHGWWPMWISVNWRLVEEFDWDPHEVDDEIAEAIRVNDVTPELHGRQWILALDPAVHDAISVWYAHEEANA